MMETLNEDAVRRSAGHPRRRVAIALLAVVAIVVGFFVWRAVSGASEAVAVPEPSRADVDTVAATRIFFGHQSVGSNLVSGLQAINADAGRGDVPIIETQDPDDIDGGGVAHVNIGVNGDPQSKLVEFAAVMDGAMGDAVDVALLKLCYVDVDARTDVAAVFESYVSTIEELQSRHPNVTFLYATVPLTRDRDWKGVLKSWVGQDGGMGPEDNVARHSFNEMLRAHPAADGRAVDIAAVEAAVDQAPTLRTHDGQEYYVLHEYLSADPGHPNDIGSHALAVAFMSAVAANMR